MRKLQLLAAAALVIVSSTSGFAQEGQRRGGGDPAAMLLQGITLSAEQQAKADSLGKKMMSDMQMLRADSTADRESRMARNRELRSKHMEALKAILTDDQKKVFEKNVSDMQARMQGGGRPPEN